MKSISTAAGSRTAAKKQHCRPATRIALRLRSAVLLGVLLLGNAGCGERQPIKVGFVASLSGKFADLGTEGRNAVIMAVDEINAAGGIKGRPLELVIADDQGQEDVAARADNELIDAGVVAIIGHMTSSTTMVVLATMNEKKMLLLSPSSSADELSGKDDFLLRVIPPSGTQADHLASYAAGELGLKRVAVAYDLSNKVYFDGLYTRYRSEFERSGGRIAGLVTFSSGKDVSYSKITDELLRAKPDGLLLLTGAIDTAMICQQLKKKNIRLPMLANGQAKTQALIQHGGKAVEGLVFSQPVDNQSRRETYVTFRDNYQRRFNKLPDFAGVYSYEAAQILFYGLANGRDSSGYKDAILRKQSFAGLQDTIRFDRYGDVTRNRFAIVVNGGEFVTKR